MMIASSHSNTFSQTLDTMDSSSDLRLYTLMNVDTSFDRSGHLVPGEFPEVRLTENQIEQIKQACNETLEGVFETDKLTAHSFNWESCKTRDGVTSFKGIKQRKDTKCRFYRSVATTIGSMEEMVAGRIMRKNGDFRFYNRVMSEDFADCEILYKIKSLTAKDPYTQILIKWACFTPAVSAAYDIVFIEYVGVGYNAEGERVGFVVQKSVDLPDFPPFLIYKRVKITEVSHIYHNSAQEGSVEITRASYSPLSDNSGMDEFEKSFEITKYIKYIHTLRYNPANFVSEKDWVPDKCRSTCLVCEKKFGPFRKKHHCRYCGEVICSSCLLKKPVRQKDEVKETKLCKKCVLKIKTEFPAPARSSRSASLASSISNNRLSASSKSTSFATTVYDEEGEGENPSSLMPSFEAMSLESSASSIDQEKYSFNTAFSGMQSSIAEQDRLLNAIAGRAKEMSGANNSLDTLKPSDRIVELQ